MTPTKTPPTEPGLYRWHDGRGNVKEICVYRKYDNELIAFDPSQSRNLSSPKDLGGYWERIDLGEPYIAPEPPAVELWEGETSRGDYRLILLCEDEVMRSWDKQGVSYLCATKPCYHNLRKVGNLVLEEA